jgi:hypothetical protein
MKKLFFLTLLLLSILPRLSYALDMFKTEGNAQRHCPNDVVVWLNIPSGVFHFSGERWYGNTKNGAFVCKQAAEMEGDRATRNGQ